MGYCKIPKQSYTIGLPMHIRFSITNRDIGLQLEWRRMGKRRSGTTVEKSKSPLSYYQLSSSAYLNSFTTAMDFTGLLRGFPQSFLADARNMAQLGEGGGVMSK